MIQSFSKPIIIALLGALVACGGSGGGNDGPPPATTVQDTINIVPHYSFLSVTLYSLQSTTAISSTTGGVNSSFEVCCFVETPQALRIEIGYNTYTEPYFKSLINPEIFSQAVIDYGNLSDSHITVSAFTTIAAGLAEYNLTQGESEQSAVNNANADISEWVGFDIIATPIVHADEQPYDNTDESNYGLLEIGISAFASYLIEKDNLDFPQIGQLNTTALTPDTLVQSAYNDIRFDGLLNGIDENGAMIMGNDTPVTANTYRQGFATGVLRAAAQGKINSADIDAVLSFAGQLNDSNIALFDSAATISLIDIVPEILDVTISVERTPFGDFPATELFGDVILSFRTVDPIGIDNSIVTVAGVPQAVSLSDTSVTQSIVIATEDYAEGQHLLSIAAENSLGGYHSTSQLITVNNTSFAFSSTTLGAGQAVKGDFTFLTFIHHPAGIESVTMTIDGTPHNVTRIGDRFFIVIDTTMLIEGDHLFSVEALNGVGTIGTLSLPFVVNNDGPFLTWNIVDQEFISGIKLISVDVEDPQVMGSVSLFLDNALVASQSSLADLNYNFDTTTVSEGAHIFRAEAVDQSSNTTVTTQEILVDNEPPDVSIISPASGFVTSTQFALFYTYDDENGMGTENVQIFLDDILYADRELGSIQHNINPQSYPIGEHTLTVSVKDASGKTASASITVFFE